jgi:hypothetical protein
MRVETRPVEKRETHSCPHFGNNELLAQQFYTGQPHYFIAHFQERLLKITRVLSKNDNKSNVITLEGVDNRLVDHGSLSTMTSAR